jgi:spermidine/putrescine transport system ATP-binding protein
MTMADTIAVMNAGHIEQLGAPADLYEHPRSTFVANFLGQSNLLEGRVTGGGSDDYAVNVQGTELHATKVTSRGITGECWIGVRPEKVTLQPSGEGDSGELNRLGGGQVADVSFVGVSTQYLVRMPWGQELAAFEQNTGKRASFAVGDTVDLTWMSDHTFLLDHSQDAAAGAEIDDE